MTAVLAALSDRVLERGSAPDAQNPWMHWRLAHDRSAIAWLLLDQQGTSVNTLSQEVLEELDQILRVIERDAPKGLVIRSVKKSGFIAGADIHAFTGTTRAAGAAGQLRQARAVVDRLAALTIPTVAIIHGHCLGGGLEIALACRYRIAVVGASFGFPEILLGLHPGLGGTVRATRLISPIAAMTMMLTGNSVHAAKAKALGLVDAVTQERHVHNAVFAAIAGEMRTRRPNLGHALANSTPVRWFAASRMRKQAATHAPRDHYPAPYALIDLWEKCGGNIAAMQARETESFAQLLTTETAQNLIRVFLLREKMKNIAPNQSHVCQVHVIGAGAMGGDIAAWCAWRGLNVTLADMKAEAVGGAVARASRLFTKIAHNPIDVRNALDRLVPDLRGEGVRHADIVIEAVPEKLEIKRKVYQGVEPQLKAGAILATNTSSIPLEDLRETLKEPGRLVGLHFFNPVSRMQLIEVVRHDQVAQSTLDVAFGLVGRIDRLAAQVRSAPGFLVNRVLTPYILEAMLLVEEGHAPEAVDRTAMQFGMPMGPIELADRVGLDICLDVADMLRKTLFHGMPEVPARLRTKVKNGELGLKTGKGVYAWSNGRPVKKSTNAPVDAKMTDRLILPMLNSCVACLREGVVDDADILDGAMIFATGFAPFRGGPLHYAQKRGVQNILAALQRLTNAFGERFKPDPGWDRVSRMA